MSLSACIRRIAFHVPDGMLTNDDLARDFGPQWNASKIFDKTGIRVRRIAAPDECASDLGTAAARKLLNEGELLPDNVDYLIFCTQTPDYVLPTTACLVQDRLGLPTTCGAVDINQGCSGFVYGLSVAKGLVEAGIARNVILITADTYTRLLRADDQSVRTLFGDAAAATWVAAVDSADPCIGPFVMGSDGSGAQNLIVRGGGMRHPARAMTAQPSCGDTCDTTLHMNGPEIYSFAMRRVPALVREVLAKARLDMRDVDYFVFHQANRYILEQLRRKSDIPTERFCMHLESVGNTVSASIPIALRSAIDSGNVCVGSRVMIVGFGVGYSWAAALLRVACT